MVRRAGGDLRAGPGRSSSSRGVALVETALCLTVILIILYGTAELAFIYRSSTTASSATRAGARSAAATYANASNKLSAGQQVADTVEEVLRQRSATDTPVMLRIYEAGSTGLPLDGDFGACAQSCLRYIWDDANQEFDYQSGTWNDPDGCGTAVDRVGVYVQYDHESMTGIVDLTGLHSERTVMRLEPAAACT